MMDDLFFGITETQVELDIYIDDKMQCRYADADEEFNDMKNSFDECFATDDLKKGSYICSALISPQTQFERGLGNYTLVVNVTSRNKTVDVNPDRIQVDNGSIIINFDKLLDGRDTIEINFSAVNITLNIDEDAQCMFTRSGQAVPMLCQGINTTTCQLDYTMQGFSTLMFECENMTEIEVMNRTHYYNIKCREENISARNTNHESYEYVLSKSEELKIIELKPSGVLPSTKAEIFVKVSEDIVINNVECGFNDNPYSFFWMEKTGYREFTADIHGLERGEEYTYYVQCTDKYGNKITKTTSFKVAE
ncbi:hypothetical protein ACFL96_15000, partial [Thermoproteota archaeon]